MAKAKKKDGGPSREQQDAAEKFKALGDPTRLSIIAFLRDCEGKPASSPDSNGEMGEVEGVSIGDVAFFLTGDKKITSTVSHHIKELRQAGLLTLERSGKQKFCHLQREGLENLIPFLRAGTQAAEMIPTSESFGTPVAEEQDEVVAEVATVTVVPVVIAVPDAVEAVAKNGKVPADGGTK